MAQEAISRQIKQQVRSILQNNRSQTPFVLFDLDEIQERCMAMRRWTADLFPQSQMYYSYKTNNLAAMTRMFADLGIGAEVASLEELLAAKQDGTSRNGVIFDGPLKTPPELGLALYEGCIVHLDSLDEAHSVAAIMDELGLVGSSKIGIRLAHSYGDKLSRFGFTQNELDELDRDPLLRKLDIRGVHIHSGSNLSDIEGFTETFARHEPYIKSILSKSASWLDIGGGYPANSRRSDREFSCKQMLEEMARYLEGLLDLHKTTIYLEPGRYLCEDSGYLVTRINHVKKRHDRTIAICDAGLNMVRSMNSWRHSVELLDEGINSVAAELYGSNCFESDMICSQLPLDITQSGQIALVRGCGGYDIPSTNYWLRSASAIYATRSGEVSTAREQQPLHSFRSRDLTNV